jgi:hypothetical protein
MKYTLICFTFNKVRQTDFMDELGYRLELRNNWYEYRDDEDSLEILLKSLGFREPFYFPNNNHVVKMSGDFTIDNTRIIVHIIKNS